ncbi:MAG: Gfo/Idh/MocA family oxidoreductase [Fimbriimonadales bacterium]|nr:Gfo/Idh/MocA family oxidoreductase [Fimbriimonadales bacterium]MDW8051872.1 Gfo/Idh/MocA family oxidoreductase [Armatimonadota bacterium]
MAQPEITRREFLKASAGIAVSSALASLPIEAFAHAYGSDRIRVGLIGCGGRGTGAAIDIIDADPSVELYAMGDVFEDRLNASLQVLEQERKDRLNVGNRKFVGLDAYKGVISSGVDVVLLCTPPAFRPIHFREAVQAGKHVFMEKPVAVCPAGARLMFEMGELASQKGLCVVAGTQRRHEPNYQETIRRIHEGAIGTIVAAACYWNQGGLWHVERDPKWSDVEWQLRNWLYFTWLSGDHIVEQHIHNIDVINWVLGTHPIRALGMGGRQARTDPKFGHIYDHFAVEFEYPNGIRVLSMCRQIDNCANFVGERVYGSEGFAIPSGMIVARGITWRYEGERISGYKAEQRALVRAIREGKPINETRAVTESTLAAIMGRMSAYTGKEVTWDFVLKESRLNLLERAEKLEFGPMPVDEVAIPGKTPLI